MRLNALRKTLRNAAVVAPLFGVAAPLLAAPPDAQPPQPPSQQELLDKVERLEAQVRQLQSEQVQARPKYDARDVDAAAAAVIRDAERHSVLADTSGISSGFDLRHGFTIASEDGSFFLHPDLLVQFRGAANYREDAKNGNHSSTESGFEVRRAKFGFEGTFAKDLSYRLLFQNATSGGGVSLQFAWAQYLFLHDVLGGGDLGFRAGQFKDVVFKEETIGDRSQLLAERSLANFLIGGGSLGPEVQGVDLVYTGARTPVHADLLLHDGAKSANTDFRDEQPVTTVNGTTGVSTTTNVATNFGVAARVDYKLFGEWGDADDLTGVWGKQDLLVVGGGADFTQADNTNSVHWTADVQYQLAHRITLLAGVYGDYAEFRNKTGPRTRNDIGGQAEVGYFINAALEAFGRYSLVKLDHDFRVGGVGTFHEFAAGVNYFLGENGSLGNRAKLTLDVTYLPNGTPAFTGGDFIPSTAKRDELVLRAQLQLAI